MGTIVMSLAAARGYSLPERGRTGPEPEPTGLVRPEHFRRINKIAPPQVSALSRDSLIINPATTGPSVLEVHIGRHDDQPPTRCRATSYCWSTSWMVGVYSRQSLRRATRYWVIKPWDGGKLPMPIWW